MQRPAGVTVIAVLDFIGAGFCVIGALVAFFFGSMLASFIGAAAGANGTVAPGAGVMAGIGVVLGVGFLVGAALIIFVALGLLKLKNWARVVTIVLGALGLLGNLAKFARGMGGSGMVWTIISLAYDIWVIWYMLQPNVKAAFGQPAAA
jgi:hypothetical protein